MSNLTKLVGQTLLNIKSGKDYTFQARALTIKSCLILIFSDNSNVTVFINQYKSLPSVRFTHFKHLNIEYPYEPQGFIMMQSFMGDPLDVLYVFKLTY